MAHAKDQEMSPLPHETRTVSLAFAARYCVIFCVAALGQSCRSSEKCPLPSDGEFAPQLTATQFAFTNIWDIKYERGHFAVAGGRHGVLIGHRNKSTVWKHNDLNAYINDRNPSPYSGARAVLPRSDGYTLVGLVGVKAAGDVPVRVSSSGSDTNATQVPFVDGSFGIVGLGDAGSSILASTLSEGTKFLPPDSDQWLSSGDPWSRNEASLFSSKSFHYVGGQAINYDLLLSVSVGQPDNWRFFSNATFGLSPGRATITGIAGAQDDTTKLYIATFSEQAGGRVFRTSASLASVVHILSTTSRPYVSSDPAEPSRVLVAAEGLWYSETAGTTWLHSDQAEQTTYGPLALDGDRDYGIVSVNSNGTSTVTEIQLFKCE